MREEHIPKVSENRLLRKISGSQLYMVTGGLIKLQKASFLICIPYQILLQWSNQRERIWQVMSHGWETELHTGLWLENLNEKHYLEQYTQMVGQY